MCFDSDFIGLHEGFPEYPIGQIPKGIIILSGPVSPKSYLAALLFGNLLRCSETNDSHTFFNTWTGSPPPKYGPHHIHFESFTSLGFGILTKYRKQWYHCHTVEILYHEHDILVVVNSVFPSKTFLFIEDLWSLGSASALLNSLACAESRTHYVRFTTQGFGPIATAVGLFPSLQNPVQWQG